MTHPAFAPEQQRQRLLHTTAAAWGLPAGPARTPPRHAAARSARPAPAPARRLPGAGCAGAAAPARGCRAR